MFVVTFFFFKQKTAYEMRISDWSSDVCSSDLEIAFSQCINKLRRVITPVVTGTIICLMGLSLIKVAMTDIAGGYGADDLGALPNLALAGLVIGIIVVLNRFPWADRKSTRLNSSH